MRVDDPIRTLQIIERLVAERQWALARRTAENLCAAHPDCAGAWRWQARLAPNPDLAASYEAEATRLDGVAAQRRERVALPRQAAPRAPRLLLLILPILFLSALAPLVDRAGAPVHGATAAAPVAVGPTSAVAAATVEAARRGQPRVMIALRDVPQRALRLVAGLPRRPLPQRQGGTPPVDEGLLVARQVRAVRLPATNPAGVESPEPLVLIDNSTDLPLPESDEAYQPWPAREVALPYRVRPGDTLRALAARFELQVTTLIWSNPALMENTELLAVDQLLWIPPINGVLHVAKTGETAKELAAQYAVDPAMVVWFPGNHLTDRNAAIPAGARIMVPFATGPAIKAVDAPKPAAPRVANSAGQYFGWPTTGVITQHYGSGHGGLDIAAPAGTAIYAAQAGEIIFSSWDYSGYGHSVLINHHNGWYTRYAHLSATYHPVGTWVERGQLIGLMGSTGRSSGPHLHFEIITRGYRYNPLSYLPR